MRIRQRSSQDLVFTAVVNRWHDDITFTLREEKRLDPKKDTIEFIPGMIGSYPNMFFDVSQDDLPAFLKLLATFDGGAEHREALSRYAINRGDDRFWATYDWFQRRFDEDEPVHGGLLDLNRYFHVAN
ncbi:MAG: fatty acid cis/trans isomerase [Anaeromyxobacter sp.]|nr:fatty acid cis/trans isomerase [Anaeromyxobacter sp.]